MRLEFRKETQTAIFMMEENKKLADLLDCIENEWHTYRPLVNCTTVNVMGVYHYGVSYVN